MTDTNKQPVDRSKAKRHTMQVHSGGVTSNKKPAKTADKPETGES